MGYDMYIVGPDGRVIDENDDALYLGRNTHGSTRLAQRLIDVGMGYWAAGEGTRPEWPRPPAGVQWQDDGTYDGQWVGHGADEWLAKEHAYLRDTLDERPGISVYKLCASNDGWWVTKIECETALKLWEHEGKPAIGDDVLAFLRAAADRDGFRVW